MVACLIHNPKVGGSNPGGGATNFPKIVVICEEGGRLELKDEKKKLRGSSGKNEREGN